LPRRSLLRAKEAEAIAAKLDAEVKQGRKHARATIRWNGQYIASFGIRRGSNVGHDYIPSQIFVSARQALDLAKCPLSKQGYFEILGAHQRLQDFEQQ
jgi:hypothetical protein